MSPGNPDINSGQRQLAPHLHRCGRGKRSLCGVLTIKFDIASGGQVPGVTGHFGQDPFWAEKTWTVWPKAWTFRPKNIDVSAKKAGRFDHYTFSCFYRIGYY